MRAKEEADSKEVQGKYQRQERHHRNIRGYGEYFFISKTLRVTTTSIQEQNRTSLHVHHQLCTEASQPVYGIL
jgi:mannose-6-phosphate isomerase-like protein (cupin superfamily)